MKARGVASPHAAPGEDMYRSLNLIELVWACLAGLATYKVVEVGPYEASLLLGRCLRILIAAMQGYV